ncbi:MAG TPA: hypothetical protein DCX13_12445 [Rhodobacteraceae bacterium]|jgi:uncharacterized protein YcaQ|nr:hypothetical protein [Paracoccaceae bacterium]
MSVPRLGNAQARAIFLARHGLGRASIGADAEAVIEGLGFVQIDSVSVVERAHHMILWARNPKYRPNDLDKIHARGAVFEHWTHDASVLPMASYPYWRLKFRRDEDGMAERWKRWQREGFEERLDTVLERVARHGAVMSQDLKEDGSAKKGTGWWDWHPSKTALEFLWRNGRLAVARREGFRKVYDLPERVIPSQILRSEVSESAVLAWACDAALVRLGVATSGEIAAFFALVRPKEAAIWCAQECAAGRLLEVEVEGADGQWKRAFARPETLAEHPEMSSRLRVLSPFDPALRDRKRAERLFGFHYRIEIFVPEKQRVYGYYVFPLMEGDRLVGRVDMKADRARDRLAVAAVWPEVGVAFGKQRLAKLEAELNRVAALAGVSEVVFAAGWLRAPMQRQA